MFNILQSIPDLSEQEVVVSIRTADVDTDGVDVVRGAVVDAESEVRRIEVPDGWPPGVCEVERTEPVVLFCKVDNFTRYGIVLLRPFPVVLSCKAVVVFKQIPQYREQYKVAVFGF